MTEKKVKVPKIIKEKKNNIFEAMPKKERRRKKGDNDYIDNKVFSAELGKWAAENRDKKREDRDEIPKIAIECIILLVDNYAKRFNWRGYTYLDEMKGEALLNCIRYMANFNLEKSDNAYGYFSKFIEHSFVNIWNKEKLQSDLRNNAVSDANNTADYENIQLWIDEHNTVED